MLLEILVLTYNLVLEILDETKNEEDETCSKLNKKQAHTTLVILVIIHVYNTACMAIIMHDTLEKEEKAKRNIFKVLVVNCYPLVDFLAFVYELVVLVQANQCSNQHTAVKRWLRVEIYYFLSRFFL